MIAALLFLLASLNPDLDSFLNGEPKGDYRKGEIEIVTEPEKISQIEENQMRRLLKKGLTEEEAREWARTGIVAEDLYWIWLRDPVVFPKGATGTYDRLLWKSALHGPPGVAVLPILPNGKIALNLNFRHATRSWELELPRGVREAGEGIESAAARELKEETGFPVKELLLLGEIAPDTGALGSVVPIYAGWVGEAGESGQEESEAIAGILSYSIDELEEGFRKGYLTIEPQGKVPLRDSFLAYALFQLKNRSSIPFPQGKLSSAILEAFLPKIQEEARKEFDLQNDGRTKRNTREYGYHFFKLENGDFSFDNPPDFLKTLGNEVCKALGHPEQEFTNIILSQYKEGFHLEPHIDINRIDPHDKGYYFDENVYGIIIEPDSEGHLYFVFDDAHQIPPLDLNPIYSMQEERGTVFCLQGKYRYFPYFHAVSNIAKERISITFRKVIFD